MNINTINYYLILPILILYILFFNIDYHVSTDFYSCKIKHHRELGCEPWFAGGIWTWNRFWAALPFTFDSGNAALQALKTEGVKNTFVTIW